MMPTDPPSILLVDDEPSVLFVLNAVLQEEGFAVECASDGLSALEIFREKKCDLLVTDFSMPGMNGEELAKEIKATFPDFPIILITGYCKPGINLELFDFVLDKPFPNQRLLGATKTCLLKAQLWSATRKRPKEVDSLV